MTATAAEIIHHRSLDMSLAKLPYVYYEARTDVFRKNGARPAFTFRDKSLTPIMYRQTKDRDFSRFATSWEILNSKLPFGEGSGVASPVVDHWWSVIVGLSVGTRSSCRRGIWIPAGVTRRTSARC